LFVPTLPNIPSRKLKEVNTLNYEPMLALDGGVDGLRLIRRLLEQLPPRLNCPGLVLLETEATLGAETLALANETFPQASVCLLQDLAGLDRLGADRGLMKTQLISATDPGCHPSGL